MAINDLIAAGRPVLTGVTLTEALAYVRQRMQPGDTYQEINAPPARDSQLMSYEDMLAAKRQEEMLDNHLHSEAEWLAWKAAQQEV